MDPGKPLGGLSFVGATDTGPLRCQEVGPCHGDGPLQVPVQLGEEVQGEHGGDVDRRGEREDWLLPPPVLRRTAVGTVSWRWAWRGEQEAERVGGSLVRDGGTRLVGLLSGEEPEGEGMSRGETMLRREMSEDRGRAMEREVLMRVGDVARRVSAGEGDRRIEEVMEPLMERRATRAARMWFESSEVIDRVGLKALEVRPRERGDEARPGTGRQEWGEGQQMSRQQGRGS